MSHQKRKCLQLYDDKNNQADGNTNKGAKKRRKGTAQEDNVMKEAPRDINIVQFAQCRAKEMEAMECISSQTWSNKKADQNLPRHMRRRAASHNTKRLPRRVRDQALRELEMHGKPTERKRPSRKHRRRPSNLLQEYTRRQKGSVWLETHIWHAKRFHMTDRWHYKLPLHPNDKGKRAAHRASTKFCLMQDHSYMCCIEVCGPVTVLVEGLDKLTNKSEGSSVGSEPYMSGTTEGTIMFYECGKSPGRPIGPIRFLWQPLLSAFTQCAEDRTCRTVWLWSHPACYADILQQIQTCFGIKTKEVTHLKESKDDLKEVEGSGNQFNLKQAEGTTFIKKKNDSVGSEVEGKALTEKTYDTIENKVAGNKAGPEKTFDIIKGEVEGEAICEKESDTVESEVEGEAICEKASDTVESEVGGKSVTKETKFEKCISSLAREQIDSMPTIDPRTLVIAPEKWTNGDVTVTSLKDSLCRFCLVGPQSQAILCDILKPADVTKAIQPTETNGSSLKWWQVYYGNKLTMGTHEEQCKRWKQLSGIQSPAELVPHCVMSITVRDPRIFLPSKKTNVQTTINDTGTNEVDLLSQWPVEMCRSPIWEEKIRNEVKLLKISEHKLNTLRSQLLVPGTQIELGDSESRIPVLLVQHPGYQPHPGDNSLSCPTGYGAGWDVILPSGWGMAFWMGLVFRGARTGGLNEHKTVTAEACQLNFPDDFPDTCAGREWDRVIREEEEAKYGRMPPAKRPNYVKLGVVAPFHCPWSVLIKDWRIPECDGSQSASLEAESPTADPEVVILRDQKSLWKIEKYFQINGHHKCFKNEKGEISAGTSELSELCESLSQSPPVLVGIHIRMVSRGTPGKFAMLCLPMQIDLDNLKSDPGYGGPLEPAHKDPLLHERKLERKRRKSKKKKAGATCKAKQNLFPEIETVKGTCSREILGFLTHGQFSLGAGQGRGKGYVVSRGLAKLLKNQEETVHNVLLVRETTSLQYRMAYFSIVI